MQWTQCRDVEKRSVYGERMRKWKGEQLEIEKI